MHYAEYVSDCKEDLWLTFNFSRFVRLYGPLSGMGTWAFERHNGILSSVKNNKQAADIPMTMMRHWNVQSRLRALASNPAPNATPFETPQLRHLLEKSDSVRGTLMEEEANRTHAEVRVSSALARFGLQPDLELPSINAYEPLLLFLREKFPTYNLQPYTMMTDSGNLLPPK